MRYKFGSTFIQPATQPNGTAVLRTLTITSTSFDKFDQISNLFCTPNKPVIALSKVISDVQMTLF
jgi:hypothetical protein